MKVSFVKSLLDPSDIVIDLAEASTYNNNDRGKGRGGVGAGSEGAARQIEGGQKEKKKGKHAVDLLVAVVMRLSKGKGAQVVYDTVGGKTLFRRLLS